MLQFTIDKTRDPAGSKLRRLLEVQLGCERMGAARSFLAHLLAITGTVIWLGTIWPNWVGPEVEIFALAAFGGFFLLAVGIVIEEMIWRIRLKRCLQDNEGVKLNDDHGSD
jgi:hypothetical protein